MGQIQSAVNQMLATGAIAYKLGEGLKEQQVQAKYGTGGEVEQKVLEKAGLTEASIEDKEKIRPLISEMSNEARITDLREKQAKIFGIPTAKSKQIREEGLARKERNIDYLANKVKPELKAADALKTATDDKLSQKDRIINRMGGGNNPLLTSLIEKDIEKMGGKDGQE